MQRPETHKYEIYCDESDKILRNKSTGKSCVISNLRPPNYPAPKAGEIKDGMVFDLGDADIKAKITDVKKRKFEAISESSSGYGTYTYAVKSNFAMLTLKFDHVEGLSGKLMLHILIFNDNCPFDGYDGYSLTHREYTEKSRKDYSAVFWLYRLLTAEEVAAAEAEAGNLVIDSGAQTGGADIAHGDDLDLDLGDYIDFGDLDGDLIDLGGGDGKTVDFEEGEIPGYLTPVGK